MRAWPLLLLLLSTAASAASPGDVAAWLGARDGHSAATLRPERVVPWVGGDRVRLAYTAGGVPVEGWDRVVVLDRDGQPRRATGRALRLDRVLGARDLSASQAADIATRTVGRLGTGSLWPARATPVVFVRRDGVARQAWAVDASTGSPAATWHLVVDAQDGTVLDTRPTTFAADGEVYPGSPVTSDLARVSLPDLDDTGALHGRYAETVSCDDWQIEDSLFGSSRCFATSHHAAPDTGGNYLFDPDPASFHDPFAEVQLYYHLDLVSRWFEDRFGFVHDRPMRGIVNFPMTNAFYGDFDGDGQGDVSFGQSDDGVDFGYDPDVVYHEFGHSVVEGISTLGFLAADDLGMDWAGGALNEGTADAFSMLITGDPHLGEYAGTTGGGTVIRDVSTPRRCPDDLQGESHADGEIWGSLVWALMDDDRVGPELTADLVYGAVATWTSHTGWSEAGTSLLASADDLVDAGLLDAEGRAAVAEHVAAANLVDCERIVSLDDGATPSMLLLNLGMGGDFTEIPGEVEYAIQVPADAWGMQFEVTDFATKSDELGWNLYVRRGEPIAFDPVDLAPFGVALAKPATWDDEAHGTGPAIYELTPDTDPPLQPGATYYFALTSANLGGIEVLQPAWGKATVRASLIEPEHRGGCACDTSGPSAGWLSVLLLVFVRRRRVSAS